jgi:formylglycine-generating enzyme required for sulfatase activity
MPTVFISYSHKDEAWKDRLVAQLAVLESEEGFDIWDDRRISAGQDWYSEIEAAMSRAAVAVLMISPDSLSSRFIKAKEIPPLLERREQEGLHVIPVIVRPCPWQRIGWLSAIQARPKDGRPLSAGTEYEIDAALAAIAVEIADLIQPADPSPPPPVAPHPLTPHLPDGMIPAIEHPIRMEFVRVAGDRPLRMGTPDGQVQDMLKRFDWAKEFQEKGYFKREQPASVVRVPPFAIGRCPVTNAQYAVFVEATGHPAPQHFGDWGLPPRGKEDHPVVNVSWHDAVAFTKWLSEATGRAFRLPTEAEWEKAARGTDGRLWPWGDEWPSGVKRANTADGGPGDTTPVGAYSPQGDGPYGCADMAGNVWEWCSTKWRNDYTTPADEGPGGDDRRVVRGGSWSTFGGTPAAPAVSGPGPTSSSFLWGFGWLRPYRILVSDFWLLGVLVAEFWGWGLGKGLRPFPSCAAGGCGTPWPAWRSQGRRKREGAEGRALPWPGRTREARRTRRMSRRPSRLYDMSR